MLDFTVSPGRSATLSAETSGCARDPVLGHHFALSVVAEISGAEVAQSIQLSIEYDPAPPFDAGRPEKAPANVLKLVRERIARIYPERKAAMGGGDRASHS